MTHSLRSTVSIRFAELASVRHVVGRMRAADLQEACYARGIAPEDFDAEGYSHALVASAAILRIAHAPACAAYPDGEPVALIGAGPHPFSREDRIIGMLATDRWPAVAQALTRWCVVEFPRALVSIGTAVARCFVWEGHRQALAWVQRMRPEPDGARITPAGHVFRAFAWRVPPLTLVSRADRATLRSRAELQGVA